MKLKDIIGSMASKFAALALALVCACSAWAATVQVSTQDALTSAVANAAAGDVVEITAAGTYTLGDIPRNITITGTVEGVVFNYPQAYEGSFGTAANGCTFGSVSFKFTSDLYHGWKNSTAKMIFNSCRFEGKFNNYQDMVFNNCYFKQTEYDYCMWVYTPNTTVEYYDCTFENTVRGKFVLVYREDNGPRTAIFKGCKFINSGTAAGKPAISVKTVCVDYGNALKATVIVDTDSCTTEGKFPAVTENWDASTTEVVLDNFILLDDRNASKASEVAIVEGSGIVTENGKIASADTLTIAYKDTAVNVESVKSDIVASGSTITENGNGTYTVEVDPYAAYVKVADGFYQNGTTYTASKDFYITNLNGLKYFRDLVNAEKTVSTNYVSRFVSVGDETADAVRSWHTGKMFANKTVHLMEDIDLNNEQWTPIGYSTANVKIDGVDVSVPYFVGVFDGGIYDTNNELTGVHKISNMRVIAESSTEKAYYAGLFGYCSYSGKVGIKNLAIENAYVHSASSYVGAFVASFGSGNGNHIIENCHLTGTIDIDGNYRYVGGIVGYARGKIKNCSIEGTGTISSFHGVGGITGYCGTSGSEVSGCMVSGVAVSGDLDYNVGGIAGFAENIVISNNLITAAMVNASSSGYGRVGGVVGFSSAPSATYLVVVDNVIENTTVEVNGTSIPTKIGLSQDNAIVGTGVTFDESGKVTGGIFENIPASAIASGYVTADNPNTETNVSYPLTIGGPYKAVIYDSDTGKFKQGFETLADALSGAADGETITLISGPDEAISAQGEVTGNKTIYITGTAKFNWEAGWLMVGRGSNSGNGTLIFKDATIYASQHPTFGSTGFNISGHEKGADKKNDGTVVIDNSYVECSYLSNKGTLRVIGNGTVGQTPNLIIYGGFAVAGRPGNETESGEDATATVELSNGAYLQVKNVNGMGVGYTDQGAKQGKGILSVTGGSKFEHDYADGIFLQNDIGTVTIDATSVFVGQKMNRGGTIEIDATGVVSGTKIFDLSDTSSLEGYVTVKNLVAPMTSIYDADGDVTLMSVAAIVNDSSDALVGRYETLAEAVEAYQDGYTIVVVDKTQAIPEGWMFKESGNVTTLVKAVAQIGTTKYETLDDAIGDLSDGDTLMVLADVTYNDVLCLDVNCMVDLDGHTLTFGDDGISFINETCEVVFANGSIASTLVSDDASAPISCAGYVGDEGEYTTHPRLILDHVAIQSDVTPIDVMDGGVLVVSNSTITVTGVENTGIKLGAGGMATLGAGTVLSAAKTGVNVNRGKLVVDGGAISGGDVGINIESKIENESNIKANSSVSVLAGSVTGGEDGIVIWGNGNAAEAPELSISGGTVIGTARYGVTGNGTIDSESDNSETVVTISGGTVRGGIAGVYNPQRGTLAISGCTVEGADAAVWAKSGSTTISGGAFKATSGSALLVEAVDYPGGNPEVAVSGGVFSSAVPGEYCAVGYSPADNTDAATMADYRYTVAAQYEAHIVRNGEVVDGSGGALAAVVEAAESGDTVTLLKDVTTSEIVFIKKSITLDGAGYTVTSSAKRVFRISAPNISVAFKDMGIVCANNTDAYTRGIGVDKAAINSTVSLDGCSVSAKYYPIAMTEGVTGVTIAATNSTVTGWCALNSGSTDATVTFKGCTLNSHNFVGSNEGSNAFAAIMLNYDGVNVSLEDTTVNITTVNITTDGAFQSLVCLDKNIYSSAANTVITIDDGCVLNLGEGNTYLLMNFDVRVSTIEVEGLTLKAQFESDKAQFESEGYGMKPVVGKDGWYTPFDPVAKIDGTFYETLADAIAAAQDGDTVTLLSDCSGAGIVVPQGKFAANGLTVDFGGFTYTVDGDPLAGSAGTQNQCFQLLKDNTITFKNGAIVADNAGVKMLIQNYSNLTLDKMTLDATKGSNAVGYVLSTNNGSTTIKDTTITAKTGGVAFDACTGWGSYTSNSVTVTGASKITGDIEASFYGTGTGPVLTLSSGTHDGAIKVAQGFGDCTVNKSEDFVQSAPDGYKWVATETSGVYTLAPKVYVAQIGDDGEKFETLAEAIDAVQDGDTVQLLADISVGAQTGNTSAFKVAGKSITIDGNCKTITATGDGKGYVFWFCEDANQKLANCSLTNLTINSTGYQIDILVGGNGNYLNTLSVDNVRVTTEGEALYASDISEITATESSFAQNGKYKSGLQEPYYAAVTVGYAGVITLTDCMVSAVDGSYAVAPFPSGGTINLNNTTVTGDLFAWVGNGSTATTPADTVINVNSGKIAGNYGYRVSNNGYGHVAVINVNGGVFKNSPANVEGVVIKTGYEVVANADETTNKAYPWTVAHKDGYIVEKDNGEGYAVIPSVDSDWIKENVKPAGATTAEIEAELNKLDETTKLKKWQAYVLNQTVSIKVTEIDNNDALKTTLGNAKTGTGLDVSYSLVKVNSATGAETDGTASESKTFTLEKADGSLETGLYKVRVHFKPTGDTSASEVTVDSTNTVGVLKVEPNKVVPNAKFVVLAVPFKELGGNATDPVKVSSYIRSGLADGDVLHVYNGDNYDTWTYNGSSWDKATNVTKTDENTESISEPAPATTATLARGTAVILRRATGNTAPLVFVGDYTGAAEQDIDQGWNLVASPSLEPFDPATKFTSGKIQIPTGGIPLNYTYSPRTKKWGYTTSINNTPTRVEDPIPAGTGFWYISDGDKKVTW